MNGFRHRGNTTNKYVRLLKNILMLFAGNFATKILTFLMVPFYTSILTTADYGTADLISTTVLLALPVFSVLMDEAVMRFTLDQTKDRRQVFTIAFTISTAGFVVALCLSPIALFFNTLRPFYWFVVLYYVVSWIYNITSSCIKGMDKLSITTTAGVIHTFVYLALNIYFLAVVKIGIFGYLLAINLSNIVSIFFMFIACKLYRNFISPKRLDWKLAKEMIAYSVPMIPDYISWWINNASDRYVLVFFGGAATTGIYSVAYKIPSLLKQVSSIFSSAWKISSVDNFGSEESVVFYNRVYSLYCGALIIGAAWLIVISKFLASIMYANDFFLAWRITPILIVAFLYSALAQYIGSIFTASKKTRKLFHSSLCGAAVNLILNIILIPKYQGTGAAIATVVGYITIWIINMINTKKLLNMNFNLSKIIPCTTVLIIEIFSVLLDSITGYMIAISGSVIISLIYGKQFFELIKIIKRKYIAHDN